MSWQYPDSFSKVFEKKKESAFHPPCRWEVDYSYFVLFCLLCFCYWIYVFHQFWLAEFFQLVQLDQSAFSKFTSTRVYSGCFYRGMNFLIDTNLIRPILWYIFKTLGIFTIRFNLISYIEHLVSYWRPCHTVSLMYCHVTHQQMSCHVTCHTQYNWKLLSILG